MRRSPSRPEPASWPVSDSRSIKELNADLFQPEEVERFTDPQKIRKKAMDYLARREHGRDELAGKLTRAGYDAAIVAGELARLADEGLQSDERYIGNFIASRIHQGKGPLRIGQELKERGLAATRVDAALDAAGADWLALATEVRVRKFGRALPGDFSEKARQMRFLQYRGFAADHIQAAVRSRGDD